MENSSNKSFLFYKICFFVLGFCGAIPWFTILSTLDFFVSKYPSYNVAQSIIIPNFVGQGVFALLVYFLSFWITINVRIKYSLLLMLLIMLSIINIPLFSTDESLYWLILFLVFCLGSITTIFQTSSTALCYVFPPEYTPLFFLGNSMSGMFTVSVRMIFMKALEANASPLITSTIGFMTITLVILIVAISLYEKLKETQLYFNSLYRDWRQSLAQSILGSHLNNFKSFKNVEMEENLKMEKYKNLLNSVFSEVIHEEDQVINEEENEDISIMNIKFKDVKQTFGPENEQDLGPTKSYDIYKYSKYSSNSVEIQNLQYKASIKGSKDTTIRRNQNKLEKNYFYPIFKKIFPMMILILILFSQSLFVFPGIVIKKKLFPESLNDSWNSLLWIFLFNASDTFARVLQPLKLKIRTFAFLVILRFLFWISFILIEKSDSDNFLNNDWFCILHLIIFGVYGGILTNSLMISALESGQSNEKETIGLLISIPAVYGMMFGSLLALVSQYI